jgi:HD-like signal output (HDOD) protein
MNSALDDVTQKAELISLPDIYLRLKSILDDPDFAMAEVSVVISQDPAITLRLLHMVNSSLFGFATKIETVSRAITLLGTQQVHDLVLATSVAQAFKGMSTSVMDMQKFWYRSVYCAVTSRQLAALCEGDKERLFVSGLLHDIGHLVMYQAVPDVSQEAIITSKQRNEPIHMVERSLLGFDYASVGAIMMQHWALPDSLKETTAFHTEPAQAEQFPLETSLVHLGALLTRAHEGIGVFNEKPLLVDETVWAVTGLSEDDCTSIRVQVEEDAREVMELVFPRESIV